MAGFKSEAQRKKFQDLVKRGEMDQATLDDWESKTPAGIPERLTPKTFTQLKQIAKVKTVKET